MTLRLTNRICLAELSCVRCVHITVLDEHQFYWVHFNLVDAGQFHNLQGGKGTHTGVPTVCTHQHRVTTSAIRGWSIHRDEHTWHKHMYEAV